MKKILSWILAVALALPFVPVHHVHATENEEKRVIQLGLDGLESVVKTKGGSAENEYYHQPASYLYYGKWENKPIKWRVLDAETTNLGENNGVFLLTEYTYDNPKEEDGKVYYDKSRSTRSYLWEGSDAQKWVEESFLATENFSESEKAGMIPITYTDPLVPNITNLPWGSNTMEEEKVFFLSITEVADYLVNYWYGTTVHIGFSHEDTTTRKTWWLRSPIANNPHLQGNIAHTGAFGSSNLNIDTSGFEARPAMNLDRNKVLFSSAITENISDLTGETLQEIPKQKNITEWKTTIIDEKRQFKITDTQKQVTAGQTISLNYTGSNTGDDEYISAILTENGEALYYTKIEQATEAEGSINIKIPDTLRDGVYELKIFNEKKNSEVTDGAKLTDYASGFSVVSVTVGNAVTDTVPPVVTSSKVSRESHTSASVTFSTTESGRYYYQVVEEGSEKPEIDVATSGITCVAGEQVLTLGNLTVGAKDLYIVVKDGAGNVSEALKVTIPAFDQPELIYDISVSPDILQFGPVQEGYTAAPTAQTVTISNTGNQTLTVNVPKSTNYKITVGTGYVSGVAVLEPESTATFTVQPRTKKTADGSPYEERIEVIASNEITKTLTVTFIVQSPEPAEPEHEHTYGEYQHNNEKHWQECTDTECPDPEKRKINEESHQYDNEQDATCDTCGYERVIETPEEPTPEPPAHEHSYGEYKKDETGHWKECSDETCPAKDKGKTEAGNHEYTDDTDASCNICGYERKIEKPEEPAPEHEHTYGEYQHNNEKHWQECTDTECPDPEKRKINEESHQYDNEQDATCDTCGYEREIETPEPPAHEHSYEEYKKDETGHWKECMDETCPAEDKGKTEAGSHEYTDDTDVSCDICGYEREIETPEPPAHEHSYGEYKKDETGHWKECMDETCPAKDKGKTEAGNHEYTGNTDVSCDICGYEREIETPEKPKPEEPAPEEPSPEEPTEKPVIVVKAFDQSIQPGEQVKQDISSVSVNGLPEGTNLVSVSLNSGFVDETQVGYTSLIPSGAKITDVSGNDVTKQYDIHYEMGELKVFPKDIWINGIQGSVPYTGKKITQSIQLYDGENLLEEKKDYTISYKNNVKAYEIAGEKGAAVVSESGSLTIASTTDVAPGGLLAGYDVKKAPAMIIKMKGNYKGKHTIYFQIERRSLEEASLDDLTLTYTGKAQKIKPVVSWDGKKLVNNRDYEIKEIITDHKTFLEPGTTVLTIAGKGNYKDTRQLNLTITKSSEEVAMDKVTVSNVKTLTWNREAAASKDGMTQQQIVVKYKGKQLTATTADKPNEGDFILSYEQESNRKAGKAVMILTGTGTDFNGDGITHVGDKKVAFTIKGIPMNQIQVEGILKGFSYTGKEILPLGAETSDAVSGNDVSGNHQNHDTGMALEAVYAYHKATGERLYSGIHYKVAYENNINTGTASIVLTGVEEEGYTGTKTIRFKILPKSLSDKESFIVSVNDTRAGRDTKGTVTLPYDKGGSKPKIEVRNLEGFLLAEGKDYTVSYKNNQKVSFAGDSKAPIILIKGVGNYKDQLSQTFSILPKDLSSEENRMGMELYAKDKAVSAKKNGWKQTFKIYDITGKTLTKSDYDPSSVVYTVAEVPKDGKYDHLLNTELKDNSAVPAGSKIRVTVTMKAGGNYAGTISGTYRILEEGYDISKASIRLEQQIYTGSEIEIDGNEDLKEAKIKQGGSMTQLRLVPEDGKEANLRVVEGSYKKNVLKGTAQVTLEGTGAYGGRKTVTFKIIQRSINTKNVWDGFFKLLLKDNL